MKRPGGARYSRIAMLLHWAVAVLVIVNLAAGFVQVRWLASEEPALQQRAFELIQVHKAVGLTVLALSVGRFAWRLSHSPPPPPTGLSPWERTLSRVVHSVFYVLLLALPLLGWAGASTSLLDFPIRWFGLFTVPQMPLPNDQATSAVYMSAHAITAWAMTALVFLHLGGVLKHLLLRDAQVLPRMLPAKTTRASGGLSGEP